MELSDSHVKTCNFQLRPPNNAYFLHLTLYFFKNLGESMPISIFLRNRLKYALTAKEVQTIMKQRLIKVSFVTFYLRNL